MFNHSDLSYRFSQPRLRAALAASALLLLSSGLGCSVLVDADRVQCSTDSDCTKRGAGFADSVCVSNICQSDPRWACLHSPAAVHNESGPFNVTMHTRDLIVDMPVVDAAAQLCNKVDIACTTPVATAKTDAAGAVTWRVDAGFSGYVSFNSSATVPSLYFFNPPIYGNQELPEVSLPSPAGRAALVQQLGGSIELGDILATVVDCTGTPATGVKLVLEPHDSSVIQYYLTAGLPIPTATSTDVTGYGGFFSVTPGTYTLRGVLESNSVEIDRVSVVVRPTTSSWTRLVPHGK